MSVLREGRDQREGEPVSGPFAEMEPLSVVHCVCLSCSSDFTANTPWDESSVVEARFGPSGNFEPPHESVESVSYFSKRSNAVVDDFWICIARCVRGVRERCFFECKSLVGVTFGASSKLERICAEAFSGTSIASLSIPDGVVELGERCFSWCNSLRSVTFGASSKLERICAYAFRETSIESLSIPDGVVELGERCFSGCNSIRSVRFGVLSSLQRIGSLCFAMSGLRSLDMPGSVVKVGGGLFNNCPVACCQCLVFSVCAPRLFP